jgi:hypothetical protein
MLSLISIDGNPTNDLFTFEPSVAKRLLVLIFSWIVLIPPSDPLLTLLVFSH